MHIQATRLKIFLYFYYYFYLPTFFYSDKFTRLRRVFYWRHSAWGIGFSQAGSAIGGWMQSVCPAYKRIAALSLALLARGFCRISCSLP